MELNIDNPEDKSSKKDRINEIEVLINEQSNNLKNINDSLILSLSDKEQISSFLKDLKKIIFNSFYENFSYRNNYNTIGEIINKLEQYMLNHSEEIQPQYIESLEFLMMLSLFHFDIHINRIGYELLRFLIDNIEDNYCNNLIDYFTKIIQLLNIKSQMNNIDSSSISSIIIYNISLALYIIMSDNQILKENKKSYFNFIKKNIDDINLIYLLFISSDNELIKFYKIFNNDEIKFIYEKISEKLTRTYNDLTNDLPKKKTDISYIKEKMNKIGLFCKILNCVTIEGNRTYIIDKLIKNMIPISERILDTLNYLIELQNSELKLSAETIENIFSYFKTIGAFSLEKILKTISFINKMFKDYSHEYLSIIIYLIQELNKISLSYDKNKNKNFILLITQIIEVVLQKNKTKNNNNICFDIYELYKINEIYNILLKIDSKVIISKTKFPNTYTLYVENQSFNNTDDIGKGFNEKNYNYLSQIYLNSIAKGNKENNLINRKSFLCCLNKFEEFKNSFKESLFIKNHSKIDNNIEKEKKEMEDKQNITFEEFKTFFLKNSFEMFNELYGEK